MGAIWHDQTDCEEFDGGYNPDAPSDENGNVTWFFELSSPPFASEGCGVDVNIACDDISTIYHIESVSEDVNGGMRNMDFSGDLVVSLEDWSPVQQAFVNHGPQYLGDFTRDDQVAMNDISLWQDHFEICDAIDRSAGLSSPESPENSAQGNNDNIEIYVHVVPRLQDDSVIGPVRYADARSSIGSDMSSAEVSILVYASDYSVFKGAEFSLIYPQEWEIYGASDDILSYQLLGYPGNGIHNRRYATVFSRMRGGVPIAIARIDARATVPGSVAIDSSKPVIIVDDQHQMIEVQPKEQRLVKDGGKTGSEFEIGVNRSVGDAFSFSVRASNPGDFKGHVYDVNGRMIKVLEIIREGDDLRAEWDGSTTSGQSASAGIYLVRVSGGSQTTVKRIVLVR